MKIINSRQNPEIVSYAKLGNAKERRQQKKFLAEGVRTCATLMAGNIKLVRLYILEKLYSEYEIQSVAQQAVTELLKTIPAHLVTLVDQPVIEKLSQTTSASGVVGIFHLPNAPTAPIKEGLVLAQVNDPGNMGTLIRTAAALKVPSIVIVHGADAWSPKVVQAAAGTLGLVRIYTMTWPELLEARGSTPLHALVVAGGKDPETVKGTPNLLVIGNEAHGINPEWLASCDDTITLPMPGDVESLNAAVAGSIALYRARL